MSSRTQFKQKYMFLHDIVYLIKKYVNLEQIFQRFILMHLNLKMVSWCHQNIILSYR